MDIIERLKKIKELADKGNAGEAEVAKKLFRELSEKYNIEENDLYDNRDTHYSFVMKNKTERKIFSQCMAYIFGTKSNVFKSVYHFKYNTKKVFIVCKPSEYIIFREFFEFHKEQYKEFEKEKLKKYKENLYSAYLEAHNIYDSTPEDRKENKNVDYNTIMEIIKLSEQAKRETKTYYKMLSNQKILINE